MRIVDEQLLEEFRHGPCCWCGKRGPTDAAHVFARGMGGGSRLDVRINLCSLCRACHWFSHSGHRPLRCDLLALVAAREGLQQAEIEREIFRLLREPKRYA